MSRYWYCWRRWKVRSLPWSSVCRRTDAQLHPAGQMRAGGVVRDFRLQRPGVLTPGRVLKTCGRSRPASLPRAASGGWARAWGPRPAAGLPRWATRRPRKAPPGHRRRVEQLQALLHEALGHRDALGDGLGLQLVDVAQDLEGAGLLEGFQVLPAQVLDQGDLGVAGVVDVDDLAADQPIGRPVAVLQGDADGAPTLLAGDEWVLAGRSRSGTRGRA